MSRSAERHGFELIFIRGANQLTPTLNTAKDDQIKKLEYFGHSNKNDFLLEYSSDIPGISTDSWGKENNDIGGIRKEIFASEGEINLYGCKLGVAGGLGQEMKKKWGLKTIASYTTTDYITVVGDAWKPHGNYIEMK
jgi:hypothetical protein